MEKSISFTIGKLARAAGVGIETIRYYQRRGLVETPDKPGWGGFRNYSESDIDRILFIKRAQRMGFTLKEIAQLTPLMDRADCTMVRNMTQKKLLAVETQLAALTKMQLALKDLLVDCPTDCQETCTLKQKLFAAPGHALDFPPA